jgi:hypothetical protein
MTDMKTKSGQAIRAGSALFIILGIIAVCPAHCAAAALTLETAPPVVVETFPKAGTSDVDPSLAEIQVRFSKPMTDSSWSWVMQDQQSFPEEVGTPRFSPDKRTCTLPVKLEASKFYQIWINHQEFRNFTDVGGRPGVPYLLTFSTGSRASAGFGAAGGGGMMGGGGGGGGDVGSDSEAFLPGLNEHQKLVLEWTDRQFRSFLDRRSFQRWDALTVADVGDLMLETLKGPHTREYFLAINTLGAMRSVKALPALRAIAYERVDRNNRDRWMSIRSIGLIGQLEDVPNLIHLVYHGNVNTRWWAQIALVKITGQNFGPDWNAWGKWWNAQGRKPAYNPEIIRWWSGQPEPEKLAEKLAESDEQFIGGLKPRDSASEQ